MKRRPRPVVDEFTIPRPRWVLPTAIAGALILFLGIVVGSLLSAGADDAPEVRFTGGTTLVTVAPTSAVPTTTTAR